MRPQDRSVHSGSPFRDEDFDSSEQRAFAERLRQELRSTEDDVDFVASARLRAARARALSAGYVPVYRRWQWMAPVGAMGAALTIALWVPSPAPAPGVAKLPAAVDVARGENVDVLLDDNDPELYEDLEMYRWLEQQGSDNA